MLKLKKQALTLAVAIGMTLPGAAMATNGYFSHGYGHKSKGMAGAGVAKSLDTMDAAINPANMVFNGNRIDAGLVLFSPQRQYTVDGNPSGFPRTFGLLPGTYESENELFPIPNFGWNMMIDDVSAFGISVYGNGGMNTEYKDVTAPNGFEVGTFGGGAAGANPVAGIDLMQLIVAPTYSRKINDKAAFGASLLVQTTLFEATGLAAFSPFSSDPAALTDNDRDVVFGAGVKLGLSGEVAPGFSLGASWQSKIANSELEDYAGLFAEQGGFDTPMTYSLGAAWDVNDQNTILFDYQRIDYSGVKSLNNPLIPNIQTARLGDDNGAGFGWTDMDIYKLGYQYNGGTWQARAGFSTNSGAIPESEVLFNILAPATVEDHWTAGFSMDVGKSSGLDFSFMYAPNVKITGPNALEAPGAQNVTIEMKQYEFGANYSWRY